MSEYSIFELSRTGNLLSLIAIVIVSAKAIDVIV